MYITLITKEYFQNIRAKIRWEPLLYENQNEMSVCCFFLQK